MKTDYDDSNSEEEIVDESEVDWKEYVFQEEDIDAIRPLDATDYVALFIASLQTIFLPLVILMIVLFAFSLMFTIFF
jgi:hypothetical protein